MTAPLLRLFGDEIELVSSGATVASGAISAAAGTVDLTTVRYPHGRFILAAGAGTAFAQAGIIQVIARGIDIDGAGNDSPVPTAAYAHRPIGAFSMIAQTAVQYQEAYCYDLPREFEVYLLNLAGQSMSAGWVLKFQPFTLDTA